MTFLPGFLTRTDRERREQENREEKQVSPHEVIIGTGGGPRVLQSAVRFQPVEKLTIAFAALLVATGLVFWPRVADHASIAKIAVAGVVPILVAAAAGPVAAAPPAGCGRSLDFHIVAPILLIFENLGPLIRAVHPVDRDGWLIAADRFLLGTDPTRLLEPFCALPSSGRS